MKGNKAINYISVVFFLATICFAYYVSLDHRKMVHLFTTWSYYILGGVVGVWIFTLFKTADVRQDTLKKVLWADRYGLLFSLLLVIFLFVTVTPTLRVFIDQANIVGVSKSMTFDKTVNLNREGYWYYLNFHPTSFVYEKRPFLMSFLTHCVHVVSGYRVANAFVVNFILLFAFFSLTFIFIKRWLGQWWAYIALILLAAQPVVSQTATSAGYELLHALFFFIMVASFAWVIKEPSPASLLFLWAQCLMFSHTRYECFALVILGLILAGIFKKIRWDDIRPNIPLFSLTSFFALPVYWQRLLTWNHTLTDSQKVEPEGVFSVVHFIKQNIIFFEKGFKLYSDLPYAGIINIIGIGGLVYFLVLFITNQIASKTKQKQFVLIALVLVGALWVITTSFHAGRVDVPNVSRYFMLFMSILTLGAVFFMSRIASLNWRRAMLLFSIGCVMVYHPLSMESRFSNQSYSVREYNFAMNFLKEQRDRNYLVIFDVPEVFTINNIGAISFNTANRDPEKAVFQWVRQHLIRDVFVFQRVFYSLKAPAPDCVLKPPFRLKTLDEIKDWDGGYFRISKVITDEQAQTAV